MTPGVSFQRDRVVWASIANALYITVFVICQGNICFKGTESSAIAPTLCLKKGYKHWYLRGCKIT